jgi:hypothetical protein
MPPIEETKRVQIFPQSMFSISYMDVASISISGSLGGKFA